MKPQFIDPSSRFPSTFTHIGRHLLGLACLKYWLPKTKRNLVADFGCGPIEPSLLAYVLGFDGDGVEILAYEEDAELALLAEHFVSGKPVDIAILAEKCGNREDNGKRSPNKHFENELLESDLQRLHDLLGAKVYDLKNGFLSAHKLHAVETRILNSSVFDAVFDLPLNGAFMGALLVNLRRTDEKPRISGWLHRLQDCLRAGGGKLVVTVTPQDLYSTPTTIDLLQEAGFMILEVLCESLVIVRKDTDYTMRGDYVVIAAPREGNCSSSNMNRRALDEFRLVQSQISLELGLSYAEQQPLRIEWPPDDRFVPVLWQNTGVDTWDAFKAAYPMPKPEERLARWTHLETMLVPFLLPR